MQVLNQAASLKELSNVVKTGDVVIDKKLTFRYHRLLAKEEALKWGCFRDGGVRISGTEYTPPNQQDLELIFSLGLKQIQKIDNIFERALVYFFFGSLNQFFYDGNKRISRLIMNTMLMSNGYNYVSIPGKRKEEFDTIMVDFYNNKDSSAGMAFLVSCYKDFGK